MRTRLVATGVVVAVLYAGVLATVATVDSQKLTLNVGDKSLNGASVVSPFRLVATGDTTAIELSIDSGDYVADNIKPFEFVVGLTPGDHRARIRARVNGNNEHADAKFTVVSTIPVPSPSPSPSILPTDIPTIPSTPIPTPIFTTTPTPIVTPSGRVVDVTTTATLRTALADARPGDVITLANGTYVSDPQFELAASGTVAAPITLVGSKNAVITTGTNSNKGYALHVTGDFWNLLGFKVDTAKKGIVLDKSQNTTIDSVEVLNIGQEAVHFRSSSKNGTIRNSYVHDTGQRSPQFGEGIYVGSANSNWGSYGNENGQDHSNNVLIENNRIENIPAEGIDLKEGTTGGIARGNTFLNAGYSGQNSADSWVDVKGNSYVLENNTGSGTLLDAFQTHVVYSGFGQDNLFTKNVVRGIIEGVGFGIYPKPSAHGNIVKCDNTAVDAKGGLSNVGCTS